MKKPHTKLIYSGGMDSTVLLYWLKAAGHTVSAISFNYGQRHSRELLAAATITNLLGVPHDILTLPPLRGSALVGEGDIPHGHYAEESMKATVVPNRNMVMLAHAASVAIADKCDNLTYGCHAGDHTIYPDCRPEFVATMAAAFAMCDWTPLQLLTPFVSIDKTEIARIAKRLMVPLELTWTCYQGGKEPCGKCGSCVERDEAIKGAE
jgi:7-cyano-7-deazaguanine synthase